MEINKFKREIRMRDWMWKRNQIFFLSTTLYILVTDNLKRIIERAQPTNIVFSEIWQEDLLCEGRGQKGDEAGASV